MRVLTNSPVESKGLISIFEADDNVPQIVVFCIPIDRRDAQRMTDMFDFQSYFSNGISTKVKAENQTNTIYLDFVASSYLTNESRSVPKFVANIRGHKIDFFLSALNFKSETNQLLDIDHFYAGEYLSRDLLDKKLVIVEPDWRQLDKLYLEEKVVFTDWT